MKVLVTGASGYIGNKLVHKLADSGKVVHALVRSTSASSILQHPNIISFKGDVMIKQDLITAMTGCDQVYHTAAKVGAWTADLSIFYDVNVEGTRNVLDVAIQTGVARVVFTSSAGVIGPTLNKPKAEDDVRTIDFKIEYDHSKKLGEELVFQYAKRGLDVVVVSPSKVYGPGNVSHSLTANAIINMFLKRRVAFIPTPGTYMVCFAFIDDVVNGQILAMEKGTKGDKYILGGANISYYEFFDRIRTLSSCKGHIIMLPKNIIKTVAHLQQVTHKIIGSPVRFTVKSVDHLFSNYTFSSEKAIQQLGYKITPLDEALEKTILFLKSSHHE